MQSVKINHFFTQISFSETQGVCTSFQEKPRTNTLSPLSSSLLGLEWTITEGESEMRESEARSDCFALINSGVFFWVGSKEGINSEGVLCFSGFERRGIRMSCRGRAFKMVNASEET